MCFVLPLMAVSVSGAEGEENKPVVLTYSTFFPAANPQGELGDAWAKEIEKRTDGKVQIRYLPGGVFFRGEDLHEGLRIGATDIVMSAFAYDRNDFTAMEAIDLPLGYPSASVATSVINEFYETHQPQELAGLKILYLHAHGPGLFHTTRPVERLEDLDGMRIRCTAFAAKIVEALGATPVAKSQGFTYVLLQDRYVQGTLSPMEVLKGWDQAQVIKYTTESHCVAYTSGFYVAMNSAKWNTLPPEIQRVFEEVSAAWVPKHAEAWDSGDREGREYSLDLGNKIISLSQAEKDRWCKAVQPVIGEYAMRAASKGLPGKEYVESVRSLIKKKGDM
jgi:TRAP-type C4-dicarboxylate transport system substrate-binding protein